MYRGRKKLKGGCAEKEKSGEGAQKPIRGITEKHPDI